MNSVIRAHDLRVASLLAVATLFIPLFLQTARGQRLILDKHPSIRLR